ncbi:ThuA domain-containing protein [Luteimonas sp. SDU101]|uniref:ThuA domain-containing protein n=1 Tax=unclassified Luteimonas TaxID=2629088 RepID=UPI003EC0CA00
MPIKPVLALLLVLGSAMQAHAAVLPRVLVLTGSGPTIEHGQQYPPWVHEFQNEVVAEILSGSVQVDVSDDLAMLDDARLAPYALVISNSLFLTPDQAQLDALRRFVTGGRALMTLHAGLLSFLNAGFYEEMTGGIFIGGPSTEPETFDVLTANTEFWYYGYAFRPDAVHPVSTAVADFSTTDELYYFQPHDPALQVIARAQNHPVMWERRWGEGRVMGLTLGHDRRAKDNPGYRALLREGVRWLVGYPLLRPLPAVRLDGSRAQIGGFLDLAAHAQVRGGGPLAFAVVGNDNPALVTAALDGRGTMDLRLGEGSGSARLQLQVRGPQGLATRMPLTLEVDRERSGNLARYHGVRASVSSVEARRDVMAPAHLVDGDLATRWASASVDPAWAMLDLGRQAEVSRVVLHWDGAYAAAFELQVSDHPDRGWRTVHAQTDGDGGRDEIRFEPVQARYLRVFGQRRALPRWGYSLHEIEVYNR